MTSRSPIDTATGFLDALARGDSATAALDLADDVVYTNVSLPTIRGSNKVARLFARMDASPVSFDYRMVNVSSADTVVLTERVDQISLGRLRLQFWVCGRFEVLDGRIAVWRDYFDYFDITKALARGLLRLVIGSAVRPLHGSPKAGHALAE
ncbi:limonene-1,2-epoxide hydrolase family protein [Gordonia sp. DT30]|uniref:limonene-1,2-epoxide hydrolase family protein n=1 Tax=Gordonia sp. DT30 TaxID=3416546 RepID=UPI003CF00557